MALLELKKYPDPILLNKSKKVENFTNELKTLSQNMLETMYQNDGLGLAAPQIGISKQIFVADIGQGPVTIINPIIIKKSNQYSFEHESCLSLPGFTLKVKRVKSIELQGYLLEKGKQTTIKAEGLLARVFQHEIDHLNGILIINRVPFWQRRKVLNKLKKGKRE